MGLATWISISGSNEHALAHGEVIATGNELQTLIRALGSHGFHIISIRTI